MARNRRLYALPLWFLAPMIPAQTTPQTTHPQNSSPVTGSSSLIIRLERKLGDRVEAMRPEHVFDAGDIVRFRVTSGSDAYLYVLDHGSSGTYSALFPAAGTRRDNRILKGSDYLVPSTEDGWFEIEQPAGFETVYFLLSPTPINVSAEKGSGTSSPAAPDSSLKPRCNDAIFQARGECIDDSAGPSRLSRGASLPPQISTAAPDVSRDIVFTSEDDSKSIAASAPSATPVVYTFRLAHR